MNVLLVKLGGSVLTDKTTYGKFNEMNATRLISELSIWREYYDGLVLIHGAGSFGHYLAKEGGIAGGIERQEQLTYVSKIQSDCRRLNLKITDILEKLGERSVSLPPSALAVKERPKIQTHSEFTIDTKVFRDYMDMGIVPVSFGDVVRDREKGFSILSGDDLMIKMASELHARTAIFVSNVDGVMDTYPSGNLITELGPDDIKNITSEKTNNIDVTGSIVRKARIGVDIDALGTQCYLINGNVDNRLKDAISGKPYGTRFIS